MTRTKIICTIGPSVNTIEKMVELMEAGMNVARINFSHGTHEEHFKVIQNLKEARKRLGQPLAIMLDTKGPEIRLGLIENNQVFLNQGHKWLLVKEIVEGNQERVSITPPEILDELTLGTTVLFDDGYISSRIVEKNERGVVVQLENAGVLKSRKGVNIPYASLHLPVVTENDIEDIKFGCANDIDIIAASFIRSAEHVLTIKKLLASLKKPEVLVIAKIENHEGIDNFDSIVQVADGIMVARGDLGVEVPLSQVPKLQKMMIRKSYLAGKVVVTATQMLESMINNPRPTRAETSDVANAIYDSTSAVMLSGETAVGKYPIETVRLMKQIIKDAENDFNFKAFFAQHSVVDYHDVPSAVTYAGVKTAYAMNAKAVFAFTRSGMTARLLSRLRPSMPIIAMTPNAICYHQMAIQWGVIPYFDEHVASSNMLEAFAMITDYALKHDLVKYGDLVVVTGGSPFWVSGTTNMILVESIGDVLVRGYLGEGQKIHGNIVLVSSPDSIEPYRAKDQIIVVTRCDENYMPIIHEAAGVVLQNHIDDNSSEQFLIGIGKSTLKSVIVRADEAFSILKEGQLVTLDPEKSCVYKGVVL